MSSTLNPKTRAEVDLSKKIGYIAGQYKNLTLKEVEVLVQYLLETALELTKNDCIKWIHEYVPKRTGQLQDNLLSHLESSSVKKGNFLKLVMGTNIDYALYVNKMREEQVRHNNEVGYAYYYGYSGKLLLNDPTAVGKYHGLMLMYARARLKENLRIARSNLTGSLGVSAKPLVVPVVNK